MLTSDARKGSDERDEIVLKSPWESDFLAVTPDLLANRLFVRAVSRGGERILNETKNRGIAECVVDLLSSDEQVYEGFMDAVQERVRTDLTKDELPYVRGVNLFYGH